MIRQSHVVAFVLALGLSSCSGDSVHEPGPKTPAASPEASTRAVPPPKRDVVPEELRVVLPPLRAVATPDDLVVDLEEALGVPSIEEAPVEVGMLLAQLSLFSTDPGYTRIRPGQPFLMSRAGEWRRFDVARYGLRAAPYGELSMAISADGRKVALADPSGLVVVTLEDQTFERFNLPVREAVALAWSPDGSTLLFKDRHPRRRPCGRRACALDLSTGRLSTVPYHAFYSAYGNEGMVFEVMTAGRDRADRVRAFQGEVLSSETELQYRHSVSSGGGPAAARDVAFLQCRRPGKVGDRGLVVVDAATGHLVSMLAQPPRQSCRLGALAWLTDEHLLVNDYISGAAWLWHVPRQRVRQIAVGETSGVNIQVAAQVMAHRLAPLLSGARSKPGAR